jgi:hypothetical protein
MHSGEINHVADMIAELRSRALGMVEMRDHLLGDVILKFSILHTAGIASDMKHHLAFLFDRLPDLREFFGEIIVIGRQIKRSRQRLKARVAVRNRMEWSDAGM